MEKLILSASLRAPTETMKELKNSKMLAWVVCGKNKETFSIKLDYSEFLKTFRKSWESNLINLKFEKDEIEVLVHQIQKHPITDKFIHVDFYAITRWEVLVTNIPLKFVWTAPAVKEWAIINEHLKEIELKCLPKDLVDSFEVDLSKLTQIWDSILVSDLGIDLEKFEILSNESDLIVAATKPSKVKETTETDESTETEEETEEK